MTQPPLFGSITVAENTAATALRDAWLSRRTVYVQLDGCLIPYVVGHVSSVAVTGAWATVDGWHVPIERVREVRDADPVDVGDYAHLMHDLRKRVGGERP